MGCCANNNTYAEIEESDSIDALIQVLDEKKLYISEEITSLSKYIKNKNKKDERFNFEIYLNDDELKSRKNYLKLYLNNLNIIYNILKNNKDIDLNKTKDYCNEFYNLYNNIDDNNKNIPKIINKFDNLIKNK